MSLLLVALSALAYRLTDAQPGQCNQKDGDYPGCGLSKLTHSSSQPQAGKKWMEKYFPVQTPGDECTDDVCDCSATSDHAAWHIYQGRVYTTRQISPSGGGPPPGNGFGLHLVDVPAHLTTGGLSTEQVEAHFALKLGDMIKFDSFMDFNAVFATPGLQKYKSTFKGDGVKYLAGTWTGPKGTEYTSVIVQVPNSQLILELCQKGSLTYDEDEAQPVKLEQRVPDYTLAAQDARLSSSNSSNNAADNVGAYIVSLGINRAVSAKAMAKLEEFYVTGMGTSKTHDSTENGVTKKCFVWPGATGNLCFTSRPDSATAGDWKVGDFEDMLNTVHSKLLAGHPFCPVDKWFDNHYAIDSQSADSSKILSYVNEKNPFHICASQGPMGSGLTTVFDPTGWGIQLDMGLRLPRDCKNGQEVLRNSSRRIQGGKEKFNPACTTDTSKCGTGSSPSPLATPVLV
jgi:hypothetical protein